MADNSQKTEGASPRRLQKARKDGDFPAAREFVSAIQFLSFILLAGAYFPNWMQSVQSAFQFGLRESFSASLTPNDLIAMFLRLSSAVLRPLPSSDSFCWQSLSSSRWPRPIWASAWRAWRPDSTG